MAERRASPVTRIAFLTAIAALSLGAIEMAMRYADWPPPALSGWRAEAPGGPVNQLGWRGHPWQAHRSSDYVVVLTGGVECTECPPGGTLDMVLENALRQYNPNARVVTLGSRGYSQDQEFLALHEYFRHDRADLVVNWASIADDVPGNMFRGVRMPASPPAAARTRLKPTFIWRDNDVRGPTEMIGQPLYQSKLTTLVRPWFNDLDRGWASSWLPESDPGTAAAPADIAVRRQVDDDLGEQRSAWDIWLSPRPARVSYGIALTRGLFRHMRDLAMLHGARFMVLLTPPSAPEADGRVALEHAGRWFVADPATRDAAVAEITQNLDTITLPEDAKRPASPDMERDIMARLADVLSQQNLLVSAALSRPRR